MEPPYEVDAHPQEHVHMDLGFSTAKRRLTTAFNGIGNSGPHLLA